MSYQKRLLIKSHLFCTLPEIRKTNPISLNSSLVTVFHLPPRPASTTRYSSPHRLYLRACCPSDPSSGSALMLVALFPPWSHHANWLETNYAKSQIVAVSKWRTGRVPSVGSMRGAGALAIFQVAELKVKKRESLDIFITSSPRCLFHKIELE